MSSIALEAVEDEDIKLSDDVEELGSGFGCTSPQQYRKTYSQVMTRINSILFDTIGRHLHPDGKELLSI